MKPQTMLLLDIWLGKPACAFFTMVRALGRLLPRRRRTEGSIRSILFVKLVEQGATVLAYDAIRRAVEMVGKENVYYCVLQENREILDLLGIIEPKNVFTIRSTGFVGFLADSIRALFRVRQKQIDCVINMEFFARAPAIFCYLTGAPRRVGLHLFNAEGPYLGDLMTHRVQHNPYQSTAATYRMLVEAVLQDSDETPMLKCPALTVHEAPPRFEPCDAEVTQLKQIMSRMAGWHVGPPIILLNPNASDILPLRKWPSDRFVELGSRLLSEYPEMTVVITGSSSEQASAEQIARDIDPERAISMAGHTSLRELLALYTIADVLVTNDSGPGHFASLTGIDSVVLFGPETPAVFGPLGERAHTIWAGLACSPCVNVYNHRFSPCTNNVCMQAISVNEVYGKVKELLAVRKI